MADFGEAKNDPKYQICFTVFINIFFVQNNIEFY